MTEQKLRRQELKNSGHRIGVFSPSDADPMIYGL
jgi:hypothetical protein